MAKFIVIEGIDGCGGNTQTNLLQKYFGKENVLFLSFPAYNTKIGKLIDDFLHKRIVLNSDVELLLYFGDILQFKSSILKARKKGEIIPVSYTHPGYVLVEMIVTDDSWYVVRNTPNVTGFVGSGTIPLPVSPEEIQALKKRMDAEEPEFNVDFKKGDVVKIIDGPFKDFDGKVSGIDKEKGKVKVLINMFGRDTPLELDSLQIKKL